MRQHARAHAARLNSLFFARPPRPEADGSPDTARLTDARIAFGVAALTVLAFVALGHDGRRIAQLMALALPALAWLLWPVRSRGWRRVRAATVWTLGMSFVVDGIARAYLADSYQAAADSGMVIGAVANTSAKESAEYLAMYWRPAVAWAAALFVAALLMWHAVARASGVPAPRRAGYGPSMLSRIGVGVLGVALLVSAAGYVSKPWRRLHPVLFWAGWSQSVQELRHSWSHHEAARELALQRARDAEPVIASAAPSTVVLVISESINRDNLGMYGYPRATTPTMRARHDALDAEFVLLKNAWSVDATTLPGLRSLMLMDNAQGQPPQHLLALAKAAGYRVWWIGNQDDIAIENLHARFADELHLVNRTPGRGSQSPDTAVLEPLQSAMADPHPHKLIVVHLMGAHPHYRLRFPDKANPFDDYSDGVDQGMQHAGRPGWLRRARDEYDSALLTQDAVMSSLLDMTRKGAASNEYRAWMFVSDHGQEVGHQINHAGHSQTTAAGYRIPAMIWQSAPRDTLPADIDDRPFRADWADMTVARLLDIRWKGYEASRDVLSDAYRWQAPALPAKVESFVK